MNFNETVTPKRASLLTGKSAQALARLFDAGALRGTLTPGGHRRYRLEDIVALIPDEN